MYFVVVAVDLQLETRSVYVLYALRDEKQEKKKKLKQRTGMELKDTVQDTFQFHL